MYRSDNFSDSESIVSYVGWNGGKARKSVAQGAGISGNEDVAAGAGETIRFS